MATGWSGPVAAVAALKGAPRAEQLGRLFRRAGEGLLLRWGRHVRSWATFGARARAAGGGYHHLLLRRLAVGVERMEADEQNVQEDAERPHVDGVVVPGRMVRRGENVSLGGLWLEEPSLPAVV